MQDKVLIRSMPLRARVGCSPQERQHPQTILVDIELRCDTSRAAKSDSIEDAIDYLAMRSEAERIASMRAYALIETIAEGIAAALLESFPAAGARVRVRKPSAMAEFGVPWAGVEVVRNSGG